MLKAADFFEDLAQLLTGGPQMLLHYEPGKLHSMTIN